jgi:SAM-dependent methyltransferase
METLRRPLQGVGNILRFNWHFYAAAAAATALLLLLAPYAGAALRPGLLLLLLGVGWLTLGSVLVSAYVYDFSPLYRLSWLPELALPPGATVVNIHAGFDESSALLRQRLPAARLRVLDFYNPARHTELAIRRARAAYPPFPGTEPVPTTALPLPTAGADLVLLMLAAHEIRREAERTAFLAEVRRSLRPGGRAVVIEHLRDPANFLAYSVGAFHFYSRRSWLRGFRAAGLRREREMKVTPFVSVFILRPDDQPA